MRLGGNKNKNGKGAKDKFRTGGLQESAHATSEITQPQS